MSSYLLDTNICIAFFKKNTVVFERLQGTEAPVLFVSEITIAELRYRAMRSNRPAYHIAVLLDFLDDVTVIPITECLEIFAGEKARLTALGSPIDNFDLLIGATAIHHNMTLVTNNTRHFQRLKGIKLEDWTK